MDRIRVLIADDHPLVRESVLAILKHQSDIEIVGTALNGQHAIEMSTSYKPDVVVMDISMPILDGIRASAIIREKAPDTHIVIMSMHVNATLVQQALQAGAKAYILKGRAAVDLPQAIRATHQGELYLSPDIPPDFLSPE
ncbi:MAG: response regulator transcription factor [Chloroflexota bacterium]